MKKQNYLIFLLVFIASNAFAQLAQWNKLNTEFYNGKQDDITFVDENTGWYVNGFGKIFHTKNAGRTWEKQIEKKGTFFRCIAFIDSNNGFAGTVGTDYFPGVKDTIPMYGTKDGGKTWSPISYQGPYVKGLCAIDIVKEQFINHGKIGFKNHIYAVGRVGKPANIMISHDDGKTWISKSMNEDCTMLMDIKMLDKNTGFVCAAIDNEAEESNALILKTTDGGETWKKVYQSNRPFENTWKIDFPSPKVGYATIQTYNRDPKASQQRIAKTVDGGETWQELDLVRDARSRTYGIGFLDENHGFVGTASGGYETLDGGKSWMTTDLGRACNKIRIYENEQGKKYGYSIGMDVRKLKEGDSGDTLKYTTIKEITDKMIEIISGGIDEPRDWAEYRNLFLPSATKFSIRPNAPPRSQVKAMNLEEFIRLNGDIYARDGFEEVAIGLTVNEYNGIANVFQSYHAKNLLGTYEKRGVNSFQLVFLNNRWWIASTTFIGESPSEKIPDKYLYPEHRSKK